MGSTTPPTPRHAIPSAKVILFIRSVFMPINWAVSRSRDVAIIAFPVYVFLMNRLRKKMTTRLSIDVITSGVLEKIPPT